MYEFSIGQVLCLICASGVFGAFLLVVAVFAFADRDRGGAGRRRYRDPVRLQVERQMREIKRQQEAEKQHMLTEMAPLFWEGEEMDVTEVTDEHVR